MTWKRGVILIGLLLSVAGCGGAGHTHSSTAAVHSHALVNTLRPSRPVWCPMRTEFSSPRFDARTLLGLPEAKAGGAAVRLGCTWRVIKRDGHWLTITADYRLNRVDLTIAHGVVTGVAIG